MAKAPQTRNVLSIVAGLIAVALVVYVSVLDSQNLSPGPISETHDRVAALTGGGDCERCHGGSGTSLTQACLGCHAEIATQLERSSGFHGGLTSPVAVEQCGRCHAEHHGAEAALVSEAGFQRAGLAGRAAFKHAGLDFHLTGKHDGLDCERCHKNADVAVLAEGQKRFLGADQSCVSCHKDEHEGAYGDRCESCHGQAHPFKDAPGFDHARSFRREGRHASAACERCHRPDDPATSVAMLVAKREQAPAAKIPARECADCHDSPHAKAFLAGVEAGTSGSPGRCERCHDAVHPGFHGRRLSREDHALTGFALAKPHANLDCDECHPGFGAARGSKAAFTKAYPGRAVEDCRACHEDAHRGQFEAGTFRGARCVDCHETDQEHWKPARFSRERHAESFALVGKHATADCESCHKVGVAEGPSPAPAALVGVRVFHGTNRSCRGCHEDPHGGQFADGPFAGDCELCHGPDAWRPHKFSLAMHERAFPLSRAHRKADCEACHREQRELTLPSGESVKSRVFHGTSRDCRSCHEDPHAGQFDQPKPAGCLDCHSEDAWRPHGFSLERHAETRFALTGSHRAIACRSCHKTTRARQDGEWIETRRFRSTPTRCSSCHDDAHHGAIVRRPRNGKESCDRCHDTTDFARRSAEPFDHGAWTGFALDGSHATASCTACHPPGRSPASPRLGRAAGRRCQDCHADPHVGQFGPTARVDCARCHKTGTSFRSLTFDAATHPGFKLDDKHRKLACASCHKPTALPGGGKAVRYKPLGTKCQDCHGPGGRRG